MENKEKEKSCEELLALVKKLNAKDIERINDVVTGIVLIRQSDAKKTELNIKGGEKMKRIYADSEMKVEPKEKHPTRKILEQGGLVSDEDFEIMLREEAEQNQMEALESIEENLIQLNKTMYKILNHIEKGKVLNSSISVNKSTDSKMYDVYRTLQYVKQPYNEGQNKLNIFSALIFDEETGEILIIEELLMRAIMIANDFQTTRKLRLITKAEKIERDIKKREKNVKKEEQQ